MGNEDDDKKEEEAKAKADDAAAPAEAGEDKKEEEEKPSAGDDKGEETAAKADDGDKKQDKKDDEPEKAEEDKKEEESQQKDGDKKEGDEKKDKSPAKKHKKKAAETPPTRPPLTRERRERKSSSTYVPEDFTQVDRSVEVADGRGTKLCDLDEVRESIERAVKSHSGGGHDLEVAHRMLFKGRGRLPKKDMANNLLSFNGFLLKEKEGQTKVELNKQDDDTERLMGQKAYKHTVSELKKICDFFVLDRSGKNDKDSLVNVLLDFLGAPNAESVKEKGAADSGSGKNKKKAAGGKRKKAAKTKKKRRSSKSKKEESEEEEEEESEEEEAESEDDDAKPAPKKKSKKKGGGDDDDDSKLLHFNKGEMPDDGTIKKWAHAFCICHDTEKATLKTAMALAAEKFGVDMSDKKDLIKEMLQNEA